MLVERQSALGECDQREIERLRAENKWLYGQVAAQKATAALSGSATPEQS
jgi:hypothetical protein